MRQLIGAGTMNLNPKEWKFENEDMPGFGA